MFRRFHAVCAPLCTVCAPFCAVCTPSRAVSTPFVHYCAPLRTPLRTLAHFFAHHFLGLPPISGFPSTSDPFGYPGQPTLSTTRHSAHTGPLWNQVQTIWPPYGPSFSLWAGSPLPKQHPFSLR